MKTNLVKLSELRIDGDDFVMKDCLVNPDKIVSITSGKLQKQGQGRLLINVEREKELRMITLAGAPAIFVDESVAELHAMLTKDDA